MKKEKDVVVGEEVISKDFVNDEQSEKDGKKVRRKYVINENGKNETFGVKIATRKGFNDTVVKWFQVQLATNVQIEYPVDEGNKAFVNTIGRDELLLGKLFEGTSENGFPFLGLEVRTNDGYRVQYTRRERGKVSDGFWFSSGDRQALKRLGFLDIIEVAVAQ